jgi:hypothetical protein
MGLILLVVLCVLLLGGLPRWEIQPYVGLRPQRRHGAAIGDPAGALVRRVRSHQPLGRR